MYRLVLSFTGRINDKNDFHDACLAIYIVLHTTINSFQKNQIITFELQANCNFTRLFTVY